MDEHYGMIIENSEDGLYKALIKIINHRKILANYKANLKFFQYDIKKIIKQIEDLLDGRTIC